MPLGTYCISLEIETLRANRKLHRFYAPGLMEREWFEYVAPVSLPPGLHGR